MVTPWLSVTMATDGLAWGCGDLTAGPGDQGSKDRVSPSKRRVESFGEAASSGGCFGETETGTKKRKIELPRVTALLEPETSSKVISGLIRSLTIIKPLFCICMAPFTV